jgi:hypothetical protein
MAVCAKAGAASAQAANKATSDPIQRFMTAPLSLARVWTGSLAGSRRRPPAAPLAAQVGLDFGVSEVWEVSEASEGFQFGRFGRFARFGRRRKSSTLARCDSSRRRGVNMMPILLCEFRQG